MSITKILTSDMINRVTAVSVTDMILCIVLSFAIGMFIYYVYRKTFTGVLYSQGFGLSLVGLCMIASILILAVSSNIVLSLGMVGALSIVRFRTAIKEPLDIVFLFWALAAGIILATGMIPLAVFGSIAIGVMLILVGNRKADTYPYLVIIHAESSDREGEIMQVIENAVQKNIIKGKTVHKDGKFELTVEVQLKDQESAFVQSISKLEGVEDVVMVSYNGDYMN